MDQLSNRRQLHFSVPSTTVRDDVTRRGLEKSWQQSLCRIPRKAGHGHACSAAATTGTRCIIQPAQHFSLCLMFCFYSRNSSTIMEKLHNVQCHVLLYSKPHEVTDFLYSKRHSSIYLKTFSRTACRCFRSVQRVYRWLDVARHPSVLLPCRPVLWPRSIFRTCFCTNRGLYGTNYFY
jgi:hypothetical protein